MVIYKIAQECHKMHNLICKSQGEPTREWSDLPKAHIDTITSSIQLIQEGKVNDPKDSHNNFMRKKLDDGWTWGEKWCDVNKTNPRLCLFENMTPINLLKEEVFIATVKMLS